MSDPYRGESFVEGLHRFTFRPGFLVCRAECSGFYAHQAQNFCSSCKEMDFIAYHPGKRELWLIEVKDYRFNARPKVRDLVEKLCRKVRDCLFLLRTAALCAPEEEPAEGISLREMARLSMQAKHIRLAFTIELGRTGLFPPKSLLATIRDLLYRELCFIDPHMVCLPITESSGAGPWQISPAGEEHSARVAKRIREAALQREQQQQQTRREQRTRARRRRKAEEPLWKQRAREREEGKTGTHADRRRT